MFNLNSAPYCYRRADLYAQADEVLAQENIVIPIYMDVQYTVIKDWVSGLVVTPIGILRLENVSLNS